MSNISCCVAEVGLELRSVGRVITSQDESCVVVDNKNMLSTVTIVLEVPEHTSDDTLKSLLCLVLDKDFRHRYPLYEDEGKRTYRIVNVDFKKADRYCRFIF